jgi:hypothetical protein
MYMKTFKEIPIKDLIEKKLNIYVRINKKFQKSFFSRDNLKVDIPSMSNMIGVHRERLYGWKNKYLSFPIFYGYLICQKYNKKFSWDEFCNNITEIKYGERSKPLFINKNIFPIKMGPYYWNILFALFFDGTSDQWNSHLGRILYSPGYTSYDNEIRLNFEKLIKDIFGEWKYNVHKGTIRIPLVMDKIFKLKHNINSFNTKSKKISRFKLSNDFENEIKNLSNENKTAILIRFLVDEGDKSHITLNSRSPNLTLPSKSKSLIKIGEIILTDLNIKYKIFKTKRNLFVIQIKRGKYRENYKNLIKKIENVTKKYPLCKLKNKQFKYIKNASNYVYKKPRPKLVHTRESEFYIKEFLLSKKEVNIHEISKMLKKNGLDLNMGSIFVILNRMPILNQNKKIVGTKELINYIPYTNKQIEMVKKYFLAINRYKSGKNIAEISKEFNIQWSTVRNWVYGISKPSALHGPWKIKDIIKTT